MARWTPDEDAAVVAAFGKRSAAEIAADLGRTVAQVRWRQEMLRKSGHIGYIRRPWTDERIEDLVAAVEAGEPTRVIARRMKLKTNSLHATIARHGIYIGDLRDGMVFSTHGIARLFGLSPGASHKTVRCRWIDGGYLRGRKHYRNATYAKWHIASDDLIAFLNNPATWDMWRVDQITDPDWREYAQRARNHPANVRAYRAMYREEAA